MVRPTDQPRRARRAAPPERRGLRAATAAGVASLALLAQGSFAETPGVVLAAGAPAAAAQPAGWAAAGLPGADGGWVGGLASDPRPLAWTTDLSTLMGLAEQVRAAASRDTEQLLEPGGSGWPSEVPFPGDLEAGAVHRPADASVPGLHGIPEPALRAYTAAAGALASSAPSCRVDWALLAGIGRVETNHGRFAGAVITDSGVSYPAVFGPQLDGSLPGTMVIRDTDGGRLDRDAGYDRAVGPMQFLPGTWGGYASDGDLDGVSDPHDIDDAALAAARYLCAGAGALDQPADAARAVRRYNNSAAYVDLVLSLADLFRTGTAVVIPAAAGPVAPPAPDGLGVPDAGLPIAAATGGPTPTESPTPTSTASPTGGQTSTESPTPTSTGSPTDQPASSETPGPTPTTFPTPTPSGSSTAPPTPAATGEVTVSPTPASTTDPTTEPASEPGLPPCESTTLPGTAEPSVVEPSVVEPSVVEPSVVEPSVVEPSVVEPSVVEPSAVAPTVGEPTVVEPSAAPSVDSPTCEPSCEPSDVEPSGTASTMDPSAEPSVVEPSGAPSVVESSVVEPSAEPSVAEPTGEPSVGEPSAEPTCQPEPEPERETEQETEQETETIDTVPTPSEPEPSGDTPAPVSTAPAALATRKQGRRDLAGGASSS